MFKPVLVASLLVLIGSASAEARLIHSRQASECNVTMPCNFSFSQPSPQRVSRYPRSGYMGRPQRFIALRDAYASANMPGDKVVGGRPAGCPHAFCGCGAAIRVFGHAVPELNLAANWLRFPRTSPAPGMVAARRGHVFVLEQPLSGGMWMAYDANSGGRATRIHARSLQGYTIVNPHAG
jgi:hypothetical protein